MLCPYCQHNKSKVIDTNKAAPGGIRRRRECLKCGERFSTLERAILASPLIIKQDGTREEFNREKLTSGIRIACTKRPVSAADIERLVGEIESTLQRMGKAEVSSRVVGDMAMQGLKELDYVAFIRYATVYLQLDDLQAIRTEIDRLLSEDS
jgi:transcriptional repressor NrdR